MGSTGDDDGEAEGKENRNETASTEKMAVVGTIASLFSFPFRKYVKSSSSSSSSSSSRSSMKRIEEVSESSFIVPELSMTSSAPTKMEVERLSSNLDYYHRAQTNRDHRYPTIE